jgi:hypothetical protein
MSGQLLAWTVTVLADNCGTPADCFGSAGSFNLAALGLMGLVALSIILDFVPFVGTAKGVVEAVTGRDLITGQELAWWERGLGIIPVVGGVAAIAGVRKLGKIPKAPDVPDRPRAPDAPTRTPEELAAAREARVVELGTDPIQGYTPKTRREGEVGLEFEEAGRVPPLRRDPSGDAEFIDATGQAWDVKGFRSDFPPAQGGYTREASMALIRREIAAGENVLVDTLHMSPEHVADLRGAVDAAGLSDRVLFP